MTASPYADDFVNLSGWTASGMAVSSGEVKASIDNSTVGKLTRTYESVAGGSNVRVGFDFVVDTSMTTNTQVSVSLLDSASTIGNGVYLKQGTGIVSALYFGTPGYSTSPVTLLAWASLVNGGRYHVEWTCNPSSFFGFYSLYDPSGSLVARSVTFNNSVDWYNITRLVVESNSNKTSISRLAIGTLIGDTTTGKYFANTASFTFFLADSTPVDLYIPGGGNINELLVYFHGVGQSPNFIEMTTIATGGPVVRGFLNEGVMLVVPDIPDGLGGADSWGNDYGAAAVAAAVAFARNVIGNTQAPQHYLSYSMGTLTAGRLIGNDGQTNVKSWYIVRGCCDIAYLEQNTFASGIDTAWGVSHQGSYGAAQTTFARGNPLGLLGSNPGAFAGTAIYMDYGTTGDTVVPQTNNCVAFDALLTTKGIAHKSSVKVYETHTENTTVGDAVAHLAQVASAAYVSLGGGAIAAIRSSMVSVLNDDTYAEPSQGAPPATASLVTKINHLFKGWRNKKTQTNSVFCLYADDGTTVDHKLTVTDDGVTTMVGEMVSGP